MSYNTRTPTRAAVSVVLTVLAMIVAPTSARAAGGGTISGTISEADGGSPIAGLTVCAHDSATGEDTVCTATDGAGEYTIYRLPAGEWIVRAEPGARQDYLAAWYPGVPRHTEATAIDVSEGSTTTEINISLNAGGTVSGTVSQAGGGGPIENAEACAVDAYSGEVPRAGDAANCVKTNAAGEYTINRLYPAAYKITYTCEPAWSPMAQACAAPTDAPTWYGGATFASSDLVAVTAGETIRNINAELTSGGTISGIVSQTGGGPIENAEACAVDAYSGEVPRAGDAANCVKTNTAGEYTIHALPTGSYAVTITPATTCSGGHCGPENWLLPTPITHVSVAVEEATTGVDATLVRGGQIRGTVTEAGTPTEDARACAYEAASGRDSKHVGECSRTNESGEYTIYRLPAGEYDVQVTPVNALANTRAPAWYPGSPTEREATTVSVTAGSIQTIGAVALPAGATLVGTVTGAQGAAIEGGMMCLWDTPTHRGYNNVDCPPVSASGKYETAGLGAGEYELEYVPGDTCIWRHCHRAHNLTAVVTTTLTAGQTTTENVALHAGGTISGTVTDANTGKILTAGQVCVTKASWSPQREICGANVEGSYEVAGLPAGEYDVRYQPMLLNYAAAEQGAPISVTAGGVTSEVDFALPELYPAAPEATASPTISGVAQVGDTVRCAGARFGGAPRLQTSTQWELDGRSIAGGNTYRLGTAAANHTLRCLARAVNAAGAATAASTPVRVAAAQQHPPRPTPPAGRNTQPTQPSDSGHAHGRANNHRKRRASAGPAGGPGHDRERLRGRRIRVIVRCRRGGQACVARVIVGISARRCRGRHDRRCRIHEHLWRGRIHIAAGAARTISARLPRWLARRVHPGHPVIVHVHGRGIHNTRFDLVRQHRRGRRRGGTR